MVQSDRKTKEYHGFEQGPIRPPSEAQSLLIRVTRNCPWNRCTFCPVYKDTDFSIRPVADVKTDIDAVHFVIDALKKKADAAGRLQRHQVDEIARGMKPEDTAVLNAALQWYATGMQSIFIQDANSLVIRPEDMIDILSHLNNRFPWVERITSYARSHTIARISDEHLKTMRMAGLNRIHIGLESGSDEVLKLIKKGVTKDTHIKAGIKVKTAGMSLSEYVMPGLGGKALSRTHALETADALNQINPDFIRLRTLAIPEFIPMYEDVVAGNIEKSSDIDMVREILLFIQHLDGITSEVKSDHILNLFQEVEGKLPDDKAAMEGVLKTFLSMDGRRQTLYQVGRRLGIFNCLEDMNSPRRMDRVASFCDQHRITDDNVDEVVEELMKRFI
ncbi:MAG: radical SAM protein [Desulfobacteraceae bacterium]|nr:radical SAM protein [Desulfobacteraceae bacterium]